MASGGYLRGVSGAAPLISEMVTGESIVTSRQLQTLTLNIDTTKFRAEMGAIVKEAQMAINQETVQRMFPQPRMASGVTVPRIGDWMQLASGRAFYPLDPRPEEIHIEDIAAALSKLCRYGGHCKSFYSVAEHCVHMVSVAPAEHALSALLHDASEAYLSDVIRPIKAHLTNYRDIEAALERAIATRFSLPYPLPAAVKALDERIIADERDQAMLPAPQAWDQWTPVPPLGVTLQFWSPFKARYEFLAAFRRYGGHWC